MRYDGGRGFPAVPAELLARLVEPSMSVNRKVTRRRFRRHRTKARVSDALLRLGRSRPPGREDRRPSAGCEEGGFESMARAGIASGRSSRPERPAASVEARARRRTRQGKGPPAHASADNPAPNVDDDEEPSDLAMTGDKVICRKPTRRRAPPAAQVCGWTGNKRRASHSALDTGERHDPSADGLMLRPPGPPQQGMTAASVRPHVRRPPIGRSSVSDADRSQPASRCH